MVRICYHRGTGGSIGVPADEARLQQDDTEYPHRRNKDK